MMTNKDADPITERAPPGNPWRPPIVLVSGTLSIGVGNVSAAVLNGPSTSFNYNGYI